MAIVTLTPKGAFHVGEPVGIERQRVLTHIPSDTLFAALCTAWAHLGRGAEMLSAFRQPGPPPFTLTSAFPCLCTSDEGGQPQATLRLYPRPLVRIRASHESKKAAGKRLKAVWVSQTLFARLCRGDDVTDACRGECFAPGNLWLDPADLSRLPKSLREGGAPWWRVEDVPRVALDRVTNASNLYHVGRVVFAAGVGLWFGLRIRSEAQSLAADVRQALDLLADAGLGGLRSTGYGAFAWGWAEEDLPAPGEPGHVVTLARYAPRDADEICRTLQSPHAAYSLVSVGGWCVDDQQHAWRRKWVRLVAEGSVMGTPGAHLGRLVDVAPQKPADWPAAAWSFGPERPVYRWGYAFPVGVADAALPEAYHV